MRFPIAAIIWLAVMIGGGGWSPASQAIEVTSSPRLEISEQVSWCASDPAMSVEEVAAGGCTFRPATLSDLARGFSHSAYWLRIELHNSETKEVERWLRVGHPRLQHVSLFEADKGGWHRTDTGMGVPIVRRPVAAPNPLLPLVLQAGEHKTVYVRVASESSIELTLTLWAPLQYYEVHHGVEIVQAIIVGGLASTALFTLLLFLKWRDKVYLYFSLSIFFEILLDSSYTGFLFIYLWPADLPFDVRVQAVAAGGMMLFMVLFVRQFIGNMEKYRRYDMAVLAALGVLLLTVLWSYLTNYGEAVRAFSLSLVAVLVCGVALLFRAWRNGSRPAGYLLISYGLMVLLLLYRIVVAFGGGIDPGTQSIGISGRFLLVVPIILAGIAQRSEELREAAMQAAARVQFLAQMSHEFRTPLNVMLGYAELMERGSQRITVLEGASAIKRSGRYLLGMIDEILDHARGEAGKLSLSITPVYLAGFIEAVEQSAVLMMRPRGNRFEMTLGGNMPEAVMMDERRVRQVLDILLSNANRYSLHNTVTLTCTAIPVNARRCKLAFSVRDAGPGIAPEEQERIFQPFVRGTVGQSSGIDGTGMGLTIARQLVILMVGEIGVESQPGEGSRFYFSFECDLAEVTEQSAVKSGRGKLLQPCKLLVVDDDPINCNLLAILLSDCGFSVVTAKSGNDARQYFDESVDLVVTDQFMPDGDGWSVLQDWDARHVPVILLSAAPPQRPGDFPSSLNFADIQLKPFHADTLLNAISRMLALEWEYAIEESRQAEVSRPSAELLAPLRVMIEEGAVTDISEWLISFAEQYPEYRAYVAKVSACNLALDFEALRRLTEQD